MVADPGYWIDKIDADLYLIHLESTDNSIKLIEQVREKKKKVGFVLNPETPIGQLLDLIPMVDQVLIMTVNPGFYGSPFLPETLDKVRALRKLKPNLDIEVDGGITDKTIIKAKDAGTNLFVSGSFILKSDDLKNSYNKLKNLVR